MRSAKTIVLFALILSALLACSGGPAPQATVTAGPAPAAITPDASSFDPSTIPAEVKRDTMEDVKALINEINLVIRQKDYTAWRGYLTGEYAVFYSEPSVLAEMSESPVLKRQGIRLKSLQDYFLNVVYPSRQSVRVDDIEFYSPTQVKAVTVAPSGERQVYYYLEKVGESWKIGTGR